MKWMLEVDIKPPKMQITYDDKIFLIGSCFTEHIGKRLEDLKFPILQNPNGILFDPLSVCTSLNSYVDQKTYVEEDLFFLHELWQSWNHHSHFSGIDNIKVLEKINQSQRDAYQHLKKSNWLIITLGSSFSYQLIQNKQAVANCHRAPAQWFQKHLLETKETTEALKESIVKLQSLNPTLQIIFTISPVRHIRDGVIENNRSKARLIEAVHSLVDEYENIYYFPAYEIAIDVLRDYRFYDIDLVHPNYAATEFVFEKFENSFIDTNARETMQEIRKIITAYRHKPFQPETKAHQSFLQTNFEKTKTLQLQMPHLDFSKEIDFFSSKK